jgi:hypothetical protein
MARAFLNNCGFRSTDVGTGSFVVDSALPGHYAPNDCDTPLAVDGAEYSYFVFNDAKTKRLDGIGVWNAGTQTLTRGTIRNGTSGAGVNVDFDDGAPQVFMGGPLAQDMPLLLVDGEVTSDVETIAIDLPASFPKFRLEIFGLEMNAGDILSFAFSADGGSTYFFDAAGDNDDYEYAHFRDGVSAGNWASIGAGLTSNNGQDADFPIFATLDIYPGDTGKNARVFCSAEFANSGNAFVERVATRLVAATGRMNRILLLPIGNADIPPTSGIDFTTGFYRLWGLPG